MPTKRRKKSPETPCLVTHCEGKFGGDTGNKGGRGLCHSCHQSALALIKKNKTTWEELERFGLAKPRFSSLVEQALLKKRKEKLEKANAAEDQ